MFISVNVYRFMNIKTDIISLHFAGLTIQ